MIIARAVVLSSVVLSLSACNTWNTLESQARIDPRTVAHYSTSAGAFPTKNVCDPTTLRGDNYNVIINLDCFQFTRTANGPTAYALAALPDGQVTRNRLASVLIKQSDDVCTKELGDLSAREAISNTALGIATSGLSTVGSLVTGEKLKSWLAGGSAFTNASRDHINAEVFRNVLASAMARAILGAREAERKALRTKFTSSAVDYSVDEMVMDVNRYHQSCSFYNGLVLVVDAVNRASPSIANDYRTLSGSIADLNDAIAELDRRIAAAGADAAAREAMNRERAALIEQRTKLRVERSALGSNVPAPAAGQTGGTTTTTNPGQ